jgi:hypothetical protein
VLTIETAYLDSDSKIEYLTGNWYFRSCEFDDFDSKPPAGVSKTDGLVECLEVLKFV